MSDKLQNLLQQAWQARRDNRLADAHQAFTEAVALCRKTGERRALIQSLKGLGQIERDLGHADAAHPLYEEAVTHCRAENDTLQLAHTVRHLGDIHADMGHVELAESCYREALMLYGGQQRMAPLDFANAIRPLAILKEREGQNEEAIHLWRQARDLYAKVNVREGVAESSAHIAGLGG